MLPGHAGPGHAGPGHAGPGQQGGEGSAQQHPRRWANICTMEGELRGGTRVCVHVLVQAPVGKDSKGSLACV